ncbi:MAG: DUF4381 domain-containing protein [Verrucomicrobiota bacterium]
MSEDPTSLDRLNDIALPPEVAWWPLASGWYVVFGVAVIVVLVFSYRAFLKWQADAYRRAALRELSSVENISGIAELLKRTALATTSREVIAEMSGSVWLDWLKQTCDEPMPDHVREQLKFSAYKPDTADSSIDELRAYAGNWIRRHSLPLH